MAPLSVAGLSLDAVRQTVVLRGNRLTPLGELFSIDGDPSDNVWRLTGDFSAVHGLGGGMTGGAIVVEGPVGRRCGAAMRGGRIEIRGDAGDLLGAGMSGGEIHVHGIAGDGVGGPSETSRRGMTGGAIVIHGNVGDELGRRMRRGLIAVAGSAGDAVAARMLAGTIVVGGKCGRDLAVGMSRGTVVLLHDEAVAIGPTFRAGGRLASPALALLQRELLRLGLPDRVAVRLSGDVQQWHGDAWNRARGEILCCAHTQG